ALEAHWDLLIPGLQIKESRHLAGFFMRPQTIIQRRSGRRGVRAGPSGAVVVDDGNIWNRIA
ncbi:MAG: hypothetical protein M3O11_01275, partial [Pseudomonadota bacterium]|nr:hypothetical protein [Pseudomonadota bacterium]